MDSNQSENCQPLLEAKDLIFSYGKRLVLDKVSISVASGKIVGLFGANGAGKTTCIRIICGLLSAKSGTITLLKQDISKLPLQKRALLGLGYLPQEPSVFRKLSVYDNLLLVLQESNFARHKRDGWINTLLKRFELLDLAKTMPDLLSGGERRKVEIARALALEPKILLFDEPFAGIDPLGVESLQKILKALAKTGIAILITDHNIRETLKICHRATIINEGSMLLEGTPKEIIEDEKARKLYLGHDFQLDSY